MYDTHRTFSSPIFYYPYFGLRLTDFFAKKNVFTLLGLTFNHISHIRKIQTVAYMPYMVDLYPILVEKSLSENDDKINRFWACYSVAIRK